MQIGGLGWLNGEALIVDRPIALQELICRLQRGNVREPHLLDHPILKGLKEPLHSPLGLRRVGRDQLDSQLTQCASKLTRGRHPGQLLLHGGRSQRLIGRMLVRIDGQRNSIALHIPHEAVHRRDRPFVLIESGIHSTGRIIDVGHQHTAGPRPSNQSWCEPSRPPT